MTSTKYIGMDVHKESISIAVRTDPAPSRGLRSKKSSSQRRSVFFLTSPFIELIGS